MTIFKKLMSCMALLFITLIISIGYAQINKELVINGIVDIEIAQTVFITQVDAKIENNAKLTNNTYSGTVLNSSSNYTPVNGDSDLILEVTFFNGSGLIYEYAGLEVQTHSNSSVIYQVTGINEGQELEPHTYVTLSFVLSSEVYASLNSIVNFDFIVSNTEDNVGVNNHASLIDAMVNDTSNGLNQSDSYLNQQIKSRNRGSLFIPSRDTLGSMAITQGNSLESMFGDSYAVTEQIEFLIQFIDTNNDDVIDYYYLFTTSVVLGENGSPNIAIGQNIFQIYRTKIVYDTLEGAWVNEDIVEGYAKSAYYEESQPNWSINRSKIPSFDPDTWTQGRLGTSFGDATWTTVNQNSLICIEANSNLEKRYYKVNVPANSSYSIIIDGDNETNENNVLIEIYNNNQQFVTSNNASVTLPTSTSQMTYYIVFSGSTTMDFMFIKN